MRKDATNLEETRLKGVKKIEDYPSYRERHRAFPSIFEERNHKRILDVAAGVGCAAQRINDLYPGFVVCNDITDTCLEILCQQGLTTLSFDIDDNNQSFPFAQNSFDAIVSLATLEHVINLDRHLSEMHRILNDDGYLYISSPNYASLVFSPRFLINGRAFHNPLNDSDRYEFYAHVRYFTYRTLLEFVSSFGFSPIAVYLPLPSKSSYYQSLASRSKPKALAFRYGMWFMYRFMSPRWASEPILCFQKSDNRGNMKIRKVLV